MNNQISNNKNKLGLTLPSNDVPKVFQNSSKNNENFLEEQKPNLNENSSFKNVNKPNSSSIKSNHGDDK